MFHRLGTLWRNLFDSQRLAAGMEHGVACPYPGHGNVDVGHERAAGDVLSRLDLYDPLAITDDASQAVQGTECSAMHDLIL